MRTKSPSPKEPAERVLKNIRRATRKHYSAEDKIRIVLDGLRGEDSIADGVPSPYCRSVMPILPTADIARTAAFYRKLGFAISHDSDEFIMTSRDAIEIAFSLNLQHDPKTTAGCIYVRVTDADALHKLWQGIDGVKEPKNQEYQMRDLPVIDPDNNLILFGSPLPGANV